MISFKPNAIIITNQQRQIIAELSYFQLPSKRWLLEQLFADSNATLKKYRGILIKQFFKNIPQQPHSVRVLDPFARHYLKEHLEYQKYLRRI